MGFIVLVALAAALVAATPALAGVINVSTQSQVSPGMQQRVIWGQVQSGQYSINVTHAGYIHAEVNFKPNWNYCDVFLLDTGGNVVNKYEGWSTLTSTKAVIDYQVTSITADGQTLVPATDTQDEHLKGDDYTIIVQCFDGDDTQFYLWGYKPQIDLGAGYGPSTTNQYNVYYQQFRRPGARVGWLPISGAPYGGPFDFKATSQGTGTADLTWPAYVNRSTAKCSISGQGATATAAVNADTVAAVNLTAAGSGYTSAPTVAFTGGGGSGAAATATIDAGGTVTGVTVTKGGSGYTSVPTVAFTGGEGTGAAATAVLGDKVTALIVTKPGSGYAWPPDVSFTGGGGTGATAAAILTDGKVTAINVASGGSGFTTAPTVTLTTVNPFAKGLYPSGMEETVYSPDWTDIADTYDSMLSSFAPGLLHAGPPPEYGWSVDFDVNAASESGAVPNGTFHYVPDVFGVTENTPASLVMGWPLAHDGIFTVGYKATLTFPCNLWVTAAPHAVMAGAKATVKGTLALNGAWVDPGTQVKIQMKGKKNNWSDAKVVGKGVTGANGVWSVSFKPKVTGVYRAVKMDTTGPVVVVAENSYSKTIVVK